MCIQSPAEGRLARKEPLRCLTGSSCQERDKGIVKAGCGGTVAVLTLAGWTSSWWPGLATGPEDAGMEVVKETGMRVRAALL